ncbi:MAG: N-acetylmuramoyl-L-alanine amidase [Candidatus Carbobacillus altaicus]|nr:N-acetylmuramoyl-L-alanine amidase [Candidatus Carbobacillus altaicus]
MNRHSLTAIMTHRRHLLRMLLTVLAIGMLSTATTVLSIPLAQTNGLNALWSEPVYAEEGQAEQEIAEIQGTVVNVRSGASTDYKVIAQVRQGERYPVLSRQGDWIEITYAPGARGWVASWLVTLTSYPAGNPDPLPTPLHSQPAYVRVTADLLNVRQGPSLDTVVRSQVKAGTILKVLEANGDFYGIAIPGQDKAYVANRYVEEASELEWMKQGLGKVIIQNDGTNLREAPSLDATILKKAKRGEQYTIIEEIENWYKIALDPPKTAYVAGWVVQSQYVDYGSVINGASASSSLQGKVIVIDPGHGGVDDGATGVSKKTKEKVINLSVAKRLESLLKASGAKVIMTRTGDVSVSLENRVSMAVNAKADAFVSIHHNTYPSSKMDGVMTFYYHASDMRLAQTVQKHLVRTTSLTDRGARYGNLFVLRENKVPAILVELGFISNPQEEQKLIQPAMQDKEAAAIATALEEYFNVR